MLWCIAQIPSEDYFLNCQEYWLLTVYNWLPLPELPLIEQCCFTQSYTWLLGEVHIHHWLNVEDTRAWILCLNFWQLERAIPTSEPRQLHSSSISSSLRFCSASSLTVVFPKALTDKLSACRYLSQGQIPRASNLKVVAGVALYWDLGARPPAS